MPSVKNQIDNLYFGVCSWDGQNKKSRPWNLFQHLGVKRGVAMYRAGRWNPDEYTWNDKTREDKIIDFCFRDVWSRFEYEFGFGETFKNDDGTWDGIKTDIFTIYVEPNKKVLLEMIENVSKASCTRWLRENKR